MSQIPTISVNGVKPLMSFFLFLFFLWQYNKESRRQLCDVNVTKKGNLVKLWLFTLAISCMFQMCLLKHLKIEILMLVFFGFP